MLVTGIAIVIFGVFYGAVYKITSNAYYAIVSAKHAAITSRPIKPIVFMSSS